MYAPSNLWPEIREALETEVPTIRMGPVEDFRNFMGAVIDKSAYRTQQQAIEQAKASDRAEIVVGGEADDSEGYFVSPTVVATKDADFDLMQRELFGPVVTAYVYDEKRFDETLRGRQRHLALRAHRLHLRHRAHAPWSAPPRPSATPPATST